MMRFQSLARTALNSNVQSSTITKRWGHTVRLIALKDLPHGKGYVGDVVTVKAGYARNHLVPQKMAVYATPQNFEKLGIADPDFETEEQRLARLQDAASMSKKDEQNLKNADILKKYLRNKVLKLWRVVDPNTVDALHPGSVTAYNIRQKLSKQLKIDLEDHETVHIYPLNPLSHADLDDDKVQSMVDEFEPEAKCEMKIKKLGEYLAKISLDGGFSVPLRFVVQQRVP
eukprot:Nitzschia sp. Nitz4//scaffold44_size153857//84102//84909//NITZ4_002728-RA/size153857-augustus-gene-0.9-mRNA-1//1//CDS//3329552178//1466//frame0